MKHVSLLAAAALVLLASVLTLLHVARNRSGKPDSEITVTERELEYYRDADDSGVDLLLKWQYLRLDTDATGWLNEQKLSALGFDCRITASDPKAASFYRRQAPRRAFVVLEYDGTGWQDWLRMRKRTYEEMHPVPGQRSDREEFRASRLIAIDAGLDTVALRSRYPDRNRVVIWPAVIQIAHTNAWRVAAYGHAETPAILTGYIEQVPSKIHVPLPFADRFRALPDRDRFHLDDQTQPKYRVQLRNGRLFEPWVTSVDFSDK